MSYIDTESVPPGNQIRDTAFTSRPVNVTVRIASDARDIQKVLHVRWLGYRKYSSYHSLKPDDLDRGENCTLLLAEDKDGNPVGTLRILDRRCGPIELDNYIKIESLLPSAKLSIAEATRFSVPHNNASRLVKLCLWKAFFLFCVKNNIDLMLVSMRSAAAKDYERLLFTKVDNATYSHELLGALAHDTYMLHVPTAPSRYRQANHPLFHFFVSPPHPEIAFWP